MADNLHILNISNGGLTVDVSLLNQIHTYGITSLEHLCKHFDFTQDVAKKKIIDLVDAIFVNQNFTSKVVFPHCKFDYLKGSMLDQDNFGFVMYDLVKYGADYEISCINSGRSDYRLDVRVQDAKQLLELHGYLVMHQFNKVS